MSIKPWFVPSFDGSCRYAHMSTSILCCDQFSKLSWSLTYLKVIGVFWFTTLISLFWSSRFRLKSSNFEEIALIETEMDPLFSTVTAIEVLRHQHRHKKCACTHDWSRVVDCWFDCGKIDYSSCLYWNFRCRNFLVITQLEPCAHALRRTNNLQNNTKANCGVKNALWQSEDHFVGSPCSFLKYAGFAFGTFILTMRQQLSWKFQLKS